MHGPISSIHARHTKSTASAKKEQMYVPCRIRKRVHVRMRVHVRA